MGLEGSRGGLEGSRGVQRGPEGSSAALANLCADPPAALAAVTAGAVPLVVEQRVGGLLAALRLRGPLLNSVRRPFPPQSSPVQSCQPALWDLEFLLFLQNLQKEEACGLRHKTNNFICLLF